MWAVAHVANQPPCPAGCKPFEALATCSRCSSHMSLLLRPKFVHDASNVLGAVKAEGCSPLDLLPGMYAAQCGDCGSVCTLRGLQVR